MVRMLLALLASIAVFASPAQAQSFGILYLPAPSLGALQQEVAARPLAQVPGKPRAVAYLASEPVLAVAQPARRFAAPVAGTVPRPITFSAQPKNLPEWQAPTQTSGQTTQFVRPALRDANVGRQARQLRYGPFRVHSDDTLALIGPTDAASPDWFARALRDHPALTRLEMIECPGTHDDRANLRLGRMIRAAGLATHVPAHGSVRSGAVELFLAGTSRSIADGAEFAVHSWRDEYGREAGDFAAEAPQNRTYVDYYREMGMSVHQARAFYAFTNSVPHHRARWLEAGEMRRWVAPARLAAR